MIQISFMTLVENSPIMAATQERHPRMENDQIPGTLMHCNYCQSFMLKLNPFSCFDPFFERMFDFFHLYHA